MSRIGNIAIGIAVAILTIVLWVVGMAAGLGILAGAVFCILEACHVISWGWVNCCIPFMVTGGGLVLGAIFAGIRAAIDE